MIIGSHEGQHTHPPVLLCVARQRAYRMSDMGRCLAFKLRIPLTFQARHYEPRALLSKGFPLGKTTIRRNLDYVLRVPQALVSLFYSGRGTVLYSFRSPSQKERRSLDYGRVTYMQYPIRHGHWKPD